MALYRHVASGTFPGEIWQITMHTTGDVSLADAQSAWSDATGALWTSALDALVSTDVVMTEVSTASISEETDTQLSRLIDDVTRPGVSEDETLPPQVALVVSLRTAMATRAGRGRFYLPPLAVSTVADGRLSSTAQGTVSSAVEAFLTSLGGASLTPVVRGRSTHTSTPITRYDVGDVFDTQRRRRDKLIETRIGGTV